MERQYIHDRVSVIMPVYNDEKFIAETLESIFAQTYKDIEIVLVDDGSEDRSAEIIAKYKESHPEIMYFFQSENMGAGVSRNKALELATGQYVAFLDSDDLWIPEKTEKQITLMKQTKCPFSYTAIDMVNEEGVTIKSKRNLKETCTYNDLLHNTIIATSSVIVNREELGDFRMSLKRSGQDYATWLMLLRENVVARGINEVCVRYRVRSASLSSNKLKSIKQVWEIQTQDEKVNKAAAVFHIICFSINAVKKYFF